MEFDGPARPSPVEWRLPQGGRTALPGAHGLHAGKGVLHATGYRLPATGYRLPATGYRLPATGYRLELRDGFG